MSNVVRAVFGCLFLGLTGCCSVFSIGCHPSSIADLVKDEGYYYVEPPSTLNPPGSPVIVTHRNPTRYAGVCHGESVFGKGFKIPDSSTVTQSWQNTTSKSANISVSADTLEDINASFSGNTVSVTSITLNLTDPHAQEIDTQDIVDAARNNLINEDCVDAIQLDINSGNEVTMINGALKASVNYTTNFSQNLSVALALQYKQLVAAKLGGNISVTGSGEISGNSIYWGATDRRDLISDLLAEVHKIQPVPPAIPTGASPETVTDLLNQNQATITAAIAKSNSAVLASGNSAFSGQVAPLLSAP